MLRQSHNRRQYAGLGCVVAYMEACHLRQGKRPGRENWMGQQDDSVNEVRAAKSDGLI